MYNEKPEESKLLANDASDADISAAEEADKMKLISDKINLMRSDSVSIQVETEDLMTVKYKAGRLINRLYFKLLCLSFITVIN